MEKPINVFNIYGGTQNNMGATIEVQNIYVGNDMKTQSVNTHVGSPLATEQAMAIWQKTAAKGWTDTQGHIINPKVITQPKAALMGNLIGQKLELTPLWAPFEELWGIKDLANKYSKAFANQYKIEFEKEVEKVIG